MKLYTEEEVRRAIELARDTHQEGRPYMERDEYDYSMDEVVDLLTPIELASATGGLNQNDNDKELFYQKQVMNPYNTVENTYTAYEKGFIEGWYKAKQTYGGNK